MTKWLKNLWFKLTYDEIAMKCRRSLGKSLFIFVLMSGICSAQTINYVDVNGVTKLYIRTGTSTPETTPGTLQFKSSTYSVSEDGSAIRVYVSRASGSDGAASVNYVTANGTAIADTDYTAASGTLNWIDGNADDKYFDVTIIDNNTVGNSRNFTAELSSASGASLGSITSTTITITEDDTASLDYDPNWPYGIGIPTPPFGIDEVYTMYNDPNNQNPELTYNPSDSGGYYTHYIDSSDDNSTDSSNNYGTKAKPRKTIPRGGAAPLAGSIVEIHNANVNAAAWGGNHIGGEGTVDMPIFYRGIGEPNLNSGLTIGFYDKSQYIIVEGFKAKGGGVNQAYDAWYPDFTTNHISVRNCDFKGTKTGGGFGIGSDNDHNPNTVNNVVFYNNKLHDNGVWDPNIAEEDNDIGGLTVTYMVSYVWILSCEIYHNEASSTMIGPQITDNSSPYVPHHIYVAKNISYDNKQSGPWCKTAKDVIFSQNVSYGMRHSSSADGAGIGFQHDPERLWFLFNKSYDCINGIIAGSEFDGGKDEIYIIGNLAYNCKEAGISLNAFADFNTATENVIAYNTVYNCSKGIYNDYYDCNALFVNNIISGYGNALGRIRMAGLVSDSATITINGRVFEFDNNSSYTGNVQVNINGLSTLKEQKAAFISAVNGDSSCAVNAIPPADGYIYLVSKTAGVAGNSITLAVSGTNLSVNKPMSYGVVYLDDGDSPSLSGMDYNVIYGSDGIGNLKWGYTYTTLTAFQAGTIWGDNCVEADPLFVNTGTYDFDLQSESPFKSIEESSAIQTVIDRFNTLYGVDISDEVRSLRVSGVQKAP